MNFYFNKIIQTNKFLFSLIIVFYFLIAYLSKLFLPYDKLIYDFLINQLSESRVNEIIDAQKKIIYLPYVIIFFVIALKVLCTVSSISIGLLYYDIKININSLIKIVLASEFVFIFMGIVKLFWLLINISSLTVFDLQFFSPLSLLNLFKIEALNKLFIYPLQLINVFEISYWIILAKACSLEFNFSLNFGVKLILKSYVVGLIFWVLFISFLQIN